MTPPPAALDEPPDFPPFSTTTAKALSGMTPPPPSFMLDPLPPKPEGGYSLDALQTIMAGTLSASPPSAELPPELEADPFESERRIEPEVGDEAFTPRKEDFLTQARRAAKAAAEAEAERAQTKRSQFLVRQRRDGPRAQARPADHHRRRRACGRRGLDRAAVHDAGRRR